MRTLKAGNKRVEAALEESRARELASAANAEAMRAQLDALLPPGSAAPEGAPSGATSGEKKVLGQATWEESKERHAQRSSVQLPRIVSRTPLQSLLRILSHTHFDTLYRRCYSPGSIHSQMHVKHTTNGLCAFTCRLLGQGSASP